MLRAAAALVLGVPLAFAVDGVQSVATHGIILSHLPPPGSAAYTTLKREAGDPSGELLEMTNAEMWSVPAAQVEALKRAAAAQGVTVTELEESSNRALVPMDPKTPMTPKQSAMMNDAMDSKTAMGMSWNMSLSRGCVDPMPEDRTPN
jgi:hypothetical protein